MERHRDLIVASIRMLPDQEQQRLLAKLSEALITRDLRLTDAIREALNTTEWLSASEVRERVENRGFDLGRFAANPLSSIYSILKRDKKVESQARNGTTVFRRKVEEGPYGAKNSLANQLVRGEITGLNPVPVRLLLHPKKLFKSNFRSNFNSNFGKPKNKR